MTQQSSPPASPAASPVRSGKTWRPVKRRPRRDGWTPERQRAFIDALSATGRVERAAREVGISATSCYRLRRAKGAAAFVAAWDAALRRFDQRQHDAWRAAEDARPPA